MAARKPAAPLLVGEVLGGAAMLAAVAIAFVLANSSAGGEMVRVLQHSMAGLSLQAWLNDGAMTLFFLLVGMEVKRAFVEGELATAQSRALPLAGAIGGMALPAAIFAGLTYPDAAAMHGWAVASATDIAFALGVLSLLGNRVAPGLRMFLLALAILDDIGAIVVIAVFYNHGLDVTLLAFAAVTVGLMALAARLGVKGSFLYLALGTLLWVLLLRCGVHATLAGVVTAVMLPMAALHKLEKGLRPWVVFGVLPLFALANAGVDLRGFGLEDWLAPVTLASSLGLFVGKQFGVLGGAWLAVRAGWAKLPAGTGWWGLYGVGLLAGIGFTMSLYIGMLAFGAEVMLQEEAKLGIMAGSLISAICGVCVLAVAGRKGRKPLF